MTRYFSVNLIPHPAVTNLKDLSQADRVNLK